jgi:hypothetical protein
VVRNMPGSMATANVTVKLTLPSASVVTTVKPRNCSPEPEGSFVLLAKNSSVNVVLGALVAAVGS